METRWLHQDSIDYIIAVTYSHGRGRLFEAFFGWRKSEGNGIEKCIFSRKQWEIIGERVYYYKTFGIKEK